LGFRVWGLGFGVRSWFWGLRFTGSYQLHERVRHEVLQVRSVHAHLRAGSLHVARRTGGLDASRVRWLIEAWSHGLGRRLRGLGFVVCGLGFRVRVRVWDLGFRV
jgi:hypothetical protein